MTGNEELKKMLRDLMTKGLSMNGSLSGGVTTNQGNNFGDMGRFRPPIPSIGVDGDISQGYSYKFQTHMDVMDKDGRAGLSD